ncbi:hypothetical protein [Paenibacillus rhizophilus]|uniref:Uncharacterized protein n=2 Tax=Paenibacillus rhizophilus TaxID=1850366 RepID=A0A3N9PA17_9BACL|nr:hypothetical protein [Paenibacillus rhizophilus]RQW13088.1 hypothetical protein EH198_01270 [Paenibacillus rhizophilus]
MIYQADPTSLHHVKKVRESMHGALKPYMNQKVKVTTIDGVSHEGCISGFDEGHLYLTVTTTSTDYMRSYYQPYYPPYQPYYPPYYPVYPGNVILPLVLYNLLALSLI